LALGFDFLFYFFLIFLAGFLGKLADLHNEHGLEKFKKFTMLFSFIWGLIYAYIIVQNEILFVPLVAVVFYWVYKVKFDYANHTLALIVILFGVLCSKFNTHENTLAIGVLFTTHLIFDLIKQQPKYKHYGLLLILLTPSVFYAIWIQNILPLIILASFLGVKVAVYFSGIEQNFFFTKKQTFIAPHHLAIIMDGNGRWATTKGLNRLKGHKAGLYTINTITLHCKSMGIKYITLFAFSTENWNRPKNEVRYLMKLIEKSLENGLDFYLNNNIRFRVIGDMDNLPLKTQTILQNIQSKTAHCTGMTQTLAINYGSKNEIVRTVNKLVILKENITEQTLQNHLDTSFAPEVDLLVRTGGEIRLSNFLLWQLAYTELFFTKTYFPDFKEKELEKILIDFNARDRRFGNVKKISDKNVDWKGWRSC